MIHDPRLSFTAKGICAFIISFSASQGGECRDWSPNELLEHTECDDLHEVCIALSQLMRYGYINAEPETEGEESK